MPKFVFAVDELLPEAVVGLYDVMAGLDPGVGARRGHGAVLQEIGPADGGDLLTPVAQCSRVGPCASPRCGS